MKNIVYQSKIIFLFARIFLIFLDFLFAVILAVLWELKDFLAHCNRSLYYCLILDETFTRILIIRIID
jgi:hypothetical protein